MKIRRITIFLIVFLIMVIIGFILVNLTKQKDIQYDFPMFNVSKFDSNNEKDREIYAKSGASIMAPYLEYCAVEGKSINSIDSNTNIKPITQYCPELFDKKQYQLYSDYFMIVDVQYNGNTANWIMEDIYGNKIVSLGENTISTDKKGYRERFLCEICKVVFRPTGDKKCEWFVRTQMFSIEEIIKYDKNITENDFDKIKQKYDIKEYNPRIELSYSERLEKEEKALKYLEKNYGKEAMFEIRDVYKSKLASNTYIYKIYSKYINEEFKYEDYGDRVNENFISIYLKKIYNISSISDYTKYEEDKINRKLNNKNNKLSVKLLDLTGSFDKKVYGHLPEPEEVYTVNNKFISLDRVYYNANKTPQILLNDSGRYISLNQLQDVLEELKDNNMNEIINYLTRDLLLDEENIIIMYMFDNESDWLEINLGKEVMVRHYGDPFLQRNF